MNWVVKKDGVAVAEFVDETDARMFRSWKVEDEINFELERVEDEFIAASGKELLTNDVISGMYRACYCLVGSLWTVEEAPTVEAVPVVQGKWNNEGYCTICGKRCIGNNVEEWRTDFCPHCGAYMRGK